MNRADETRVFTEGDATRFLAAACDHGGRGASRVRWSRVPDATALAADLNRAAPDLLAPAPSPLHQRRDALRAMLPHLDALADALSREELAGDLRALCFWNKPLASLDAIEPRMLDDLGPRLRDVADTVRAGLSNTAGGRRHALGPAHRRSGLQAVMVIYRAHTGGSIGRDPSGPCWRFACAVLMHLGIPAPSAMQWREAVDSHPKRRG